MAKAKKDPQKKVKPIKALTGLSKEMKADIEKMIEKGEKQIDKKLAALKNVFEKLSGAPKAKAKKAVKKAKPAKAAKTKPIKAKKKSVMKKKAQQQAQEAE